MKKALSLLLAMCMFLCLLCSCGTTDTTEEGGSSDSGKKDDQNPTVIVDPTAKELLGGYHYYSVDQNGDDTYTEDVITSIEWTATGAVMTGYEEQSDGDRSDMRMEITFDEQKRPATLERTVTDTDGEVEESRMRFEYPAERTVKMINSGFGDGESYCIYEYDEKGNRIREEYPTYTYIYEYDSHGNCVLKKTDYADAEQMDGETTTTYTYDADGKIVTEIQINSSGKETQTRYFYYPNGNVMMKMSVSDSGNVNYNFQPYNPKDMLAWSYGMSEAGGMEYTAEKDAEGRIVKVTAVTATATDPAYNRTRTMTFAYDEQGRLVKTTDTDGDERAYEYDVQGRLVKHTRGTSVRTYAYDNKGRLVKEESVSPYSTYTTIREYNDAGMVIKMTEESYYPASELYPEGQTSTETVDITYVENAKCQVNDLWAELILMSLVGGVY